MRCRLVRDEGKEGKPVRGRPGLRETGVVAALLLVSAAGFTQDNVRVSVKHILNSDNVRSSGIYLFDATVRETFLQMNNVLDDLDVRWRFDLVEISEVRDSSEYFSMSTDEVAAFERLARDEQPGKYKWRADAINIYIVNDLEGGAAGISSFPGNDGGHSEVTIIQNHYQGEITNLAGGWLHEIGHYLSLRHTFQCATADCDKNVCQGEGASHRGWSVACPDVCPHDDNLMSYEDTQEFWEFRITGTFTACQIENMDFELYDPRGDRNHVLEPCADGCAREVEDCRAACQGTRDACGGACGVVDTTCRAGCGSVGLACRGTCETAGDSCRAGCGPAADTCYAACEVPCFFDEDSDACKECRAACSSVVADCTAECNRAEVNCKAPCPSPRSCYDECNGQMTDCQGACDDIADVCNAPCNLIEYECRKDCPIRHFPPLNLARLPGVVASQTSTHGGNLFPAGLAIDERLDTFSHTQAGSTGAWQIDLGAEYALETIVLYNRADCCGSRLRDITVRILDAGHVPQLTHGLLNPGNSWATAGKGPRRLVSDLLHLSGSRVRGRYVHIERTRDPGGANPDDRDVLSLAEVAVYGQWLPLPPGTPVRLNDTQWSVTASQSSTGYEGSAERALDGDTSGNYLAGSVTHTADGDPAPWWEVDMGGSHAIGRIVIWNRTDCCSWRLSNFKVSLLDGLRHAVHESVHFADGGWPDTSSAGYEVFTEGLEGRIVRIDLLADPNGASRTLSLAEVEIITATGNDARRFVRGDADSSGRIDLSDALAVLNFLFSSGREPACLDAADADDVGSGSLTITDAIRILGWLFSGGPAPGEPGPTATEYTAGDCGTDPTSGDGLGCVTPGPACR